MPSPKPNKANFAKSQATPKKLQIFIAAQVCRCSKVSSHSAELQRSVSGIVRVQRSASRKTLRQLPVLLKKAASHWRRWYWYTQVDLLRRRSLYLQEVSSHLAVSEASRPRAQRCARHRLYRNQQRYPTPKTASTQISNLNARRLQLRACALSRAGMSLAGCYCYKCFPLSELSCTASSYPGWQTGLLCAT